MMRVIPLLLAASLAAGCARRGEEPAETPAPAPLACDASKAQGWIGRHLTPALVDAAQVAAGARRSRTITPGTMVTMDYSPDRLNIEVNEAGVVTVIRCG